MTGHRWAGVLLGPLVLALSLTACAQIFGDRDEKATGTAPASVIEGGLAYDVKFEGPMDPSLERSLRDASQAVQLIDRPPPSEFALVRRAEADLVRLDDALRGLGRYDGKVTYRIVESVEAKASDDKVDEAGKKRSPSTVLLFEVDPGPLYMFAKRKVELEGDAYGFKPPMPNKLGLKDDEPAIAQVVLDAEATLLRSALDAGHALAKLGQRDAVVDHERRQMDLVLRIRPGPLYSLGAIDFRGADDVDRRYLTRLVPVRPDTRFNPSGIEEGRNALVESGLFSTVHTEIATVPDAEGKLPVTYELYPRKHRSIGGGAGYKTDEGLNANVFWEHRNLTGAGEKLRADLEESLIRQIASLNFKKPAFLGRRQSLLAELVAKQEHLDAYDSSSLSAGTGFERQFTKTVSGSLGLAYRLADVDDKDGSEHFALVSVPGRLDWNFSDDLFDPTTGGRVRLDAGPYWDTLDVGQRFVKARLSHSRYVPLRNDPRLILAARGAMGTIFGLERDKIPADERFYAGGGGSVRGIPLSRAGPKDRDDDPVGGRSFAELAAELRLNITPTIGVVTFLDVGSAYTDGIPEIGHGLRYGAGAGLRYTTPIGPLRLDIAVPVDKSDRIDDPLQVYVSIGQAF